MDEREIDSPAQHVDRKAGEEMTTTPAGNSLGFYGRLVIVVVLVVALSEAIPEIVNSILVLLLIGLVLGHYKQFSYMTTLLGTVGK